MLVVIRYCLEMQLGLLKRYNALAKDTYTPMYNNRRFSHTWVLGKSGVGKTTALVRWALDDIYNGEGLAFFDPHGHAIEEILSRTLPARRSDVILYDPSDFDYPIAFNVLYNVAEQRNPFVASAVVDCVPIRLMQTPTTYRANDAGGVARLVENWRTGVSS